MSILPCLPGGDPINFIDPDGMTRFYVDLFGRIISTEERMIKNSEMNETDAALDDYDQVIIIGEDGQIIDSSPKYEVGTIKNTIVSTAIGKDNQVVDFTAFEIRGDDAGSAIFEFLANNLTTKEIGTEFALTTVGIAGKKGLNFVSTSHTKGSEAGAGWLFEGRLKYGYTLRDVIHSHPTGDSPGDSDLKFRNGIIEEMSKYSSPNFKIYHVPTKTYIDYTKTPNAAH